MHCTQENIGDNVFKCMIHKCRPSKNCSKESMKDAFKKQQKLSEVSDETPNEDLFVSLNILLGVCTQGIHFKKRAVLTQGNGISTKSSIFMKGFKHIF